MAFEQATRALDPNIIDTTLKSRSDLQKDIGQTQDQITFQQQALKNVDQLSGVDLENLARQLASQGVVSDQDISQITAVGRSRLAGVASGYGDAVLRDALRQKIIKNLPTLQNQITNKSQNIFDQDIAGIRQGEQTALKELGSQKTALDTAIDQRLAAMLDETGFQANMARQQAAEGYAARGLGRSSFAQSGLEDITSKELGQRSQFQSQASEGKTLVTRAQEKVQQKIADTRKQMEIDRNLATLQSSQDIGFAFDKQELENTIATQLANMQLQANQNSALASIMGGIFGGAASIVTGDIFKKKR
jgi:hypothetical protein